MNIGLIVHNIGYFTSLIISLSLGVFVLSRGWNKKTHILYFLTTISFVIYTVAHLLAVNTLDPVVSKNFSLLTNVIIFTVCFNAHFGFAVFKKIKDHKFGLRLMYGLAVAITVWIITAPGQFALDSAPKQFFPNFLVAGPNYWVLALFFVGTAIYFFTVLAKGYKDLDSIDKNRMNYFFGSFGFAYLIGSLMFLPVFGVNINMLPTAIIGLYTLPLAYGLLKYDLLELHVVAKNAVGYFLLVVSVGLSTTGINIFNNYLIQNFPDFPFWPIPFFSGILILIVGLFVWKQIRQVDVLKYEFINNVSHKFRTPLTHIRWLAEDLRETNDEATRNKYVDQIQYASLRLFELTNAVIDVSRDENDLYLYRFTPVHLNSLLKELFTTHDDLIERKKLKVEFDVPDELPTIQADKTRLQFALQIIFENALVYTPEEGKVSIKVRQIGGEVLITFKDNGIGVPEDDIDRIFSKFYRSVNARHTDTEGMGIGLYMAKNIVDKHRGKIWVTSAGEGTGTEFTVSIPLS